MTRPILIALAALTLGGCYESDIDPMMRQEKFKAYRENDFYPDGRAMRVPPAGTVPRERPIDAMQAAPPVTAALVARGRDRFDIHCAVCHGFAGDGDSVVASKMSLRAPPSFHDDRLRAYTVQQIYDVITNGYGVMYSYADRVSPPDRWAIVAYIRALQLSQAAPVASLPPEARAKLAAIQEPGQ